MAPQTNLETKSIIHFYILFVFNLNQRIFRKALAYILGSTDPCPTAVHMEPFSTSVLKVLT